MTEKSIVRARIDERTKREAAAVLKTIGLTVSDAFRLLLVRVAAEKALPFELLNPNAETVAAMKAARRGELVKVGKPDKLLQRSECARLNTQRVLSVTTVNENRGSGGRRRTSSIRRSGGRVRGSRRPASATAPRRSGAPRDAGACDSAGRNRA
jgi:DNA-damage-inducible protein J